jgi:hypothetical protein
MGGCVGFIVVESGGTGKDGQLRFSQGRLWDCENSNVLGHPGLAL